MNTSKTQQTKTRSPLGVLQLSRTAVANKDPKFDYSFRQKDPQSQSRSGQQGWVPVTGENYNGETWASPIASHAVKSAGKKEIHLEDTMLYKRPKAASQFYQKIEDTKYNNQVIAINQAAERVRTPLRQLDKNSTVRDDSTKFSQRVGPNDESDVDIFS